MSSIEDRIADLERRADALALMSAKIATLETAVDALGSRSAGAVNSRLELHGRVDALEAWKENKTHYDEDRSRRIDRIGRELDEFASDYESLRQAFLRLEKDALDRLNVLEHARADSAQPGWDERPPMVPAKPKESASPTGSTCTASSWLPSTM